MEYICDAPGDRTWFRLVTEGEAVLESELMRHAVEKYFRREWEQGGRELPAADHACSSSRTSARRRISSARCRCS